MLPATTSRLRHVRRPGPALRLLVSAPAVLLASAGLLSAGARWFGGGSAGARDSAELQRLYSSPGGLYRAADIRGNGSEPPAQRFASVPVRHDLTPRSGDRICPITRTKANPQIAWTVGGRTYEFCCPPCVDEFVQRAKTAPQSIRPPEEYVQR